MAWNRWRLERAVLYVGQEVSLRESGEKGNRGGTALLALDAELGFQRNCARTTERESRLTRRNLGSSLFPANVRVKDNQKTLLGKWNGGDTDARCGHGVRVGVECEL